MALDLTVEQAQELLDEIRSRCPVRAFFRSASETQKKVLARDSMYTVVKSANQGGKTTTAVVDCAAALRGIHPHKPWCGPIKVLIVVPSRTQASGIWGARLLERSDIRAKIQSKAGVTINLAEEPLIPASEIEHISMAHSPQGKYPGVLTLKNGCEARIALSGDLNSWKRFQGMQFDLIYRDEAVGNQNMSDELLPRLVSAQTSVQKGEKPWGGEILWVATSTLINDEFEEFDDRCEKGVPGHRAYWINPNENPAVSMEVRTAMLSSMSEDAGAVRLMGKADAIDEVLIFKHQLSDKRHRIHEPYEPSPSDNIWCVWDPGWDHPYGLVFAAIRENNPQQLIIWKTITERQRTLDHIANQIAITLDGRSVEAFIFDPASKKTEYSRGESVSYQMEKLLENMGVKSHRGILFGRNRYEDTLPTMKRYMDPDPENPTADPLLKIATDTEEINNGCDKAWSQLLKYRRKPKMSETRGHNIHRKDDEIVDCIRYLISRKPYWCKRDANVARHAPIARASAIIAPSPLKPDRLSITPDMSDEQKIHVMRLRESVRSTESLFSHGMPRMPTGYLGF